MKFIRGNAPLAITVATVLVVSIVGYIFFSKYFSLEPYVAGMASVEKAIASTVSKVAAEMKPLDTVEYDRRMLLLANYSSTTSTTTSRIWPVQAPYPKAGAILPFKRIVAYYGNFYSKGMGVLGEYPEDVMLSMLEKEMKRWNSADPETPVVPAINYIAVTAQGYAGDGKYRLRMPESQLDNAVRLARKINGIVILDVQVGLSTVQVEIPLLEKYLKMPEVHIGLDPEFSMKTGAKPGKVIGSMNAQDINFVANYMAKLVQENNLPPKVLVVHRFTEEMVVGYKQMKPLPEVQIVIDMDGWGPPGKKIGTYRQVIIPEPVQFTGFKLFYKNDLRSPSTRLLTPKELLSLQPRPSFIQYQ